jgi:hypothetical protein
MMKKKFRNQLGVSALVIVMGTAFCIILPLGFLSYEFLRYSSIQQELRAVCDAAALAGAVGIATNGGATSSGGTVTIGFNTLWQQDNQAMSGAYNQFCVNSVTDCQFVPVGQSGANVNPQEAMSSLQPLHFNNSTPWTNVTPRTAQVNFVLIDASGNQTNWANGGGPDQPGLVSATKLRVDAYYGYSPPILGGLGIGPFTMAASATGGLPQLDVILCFDISGSMDDFTNVTFCNRYWVDTRNSTMTSTDVTNLGLDPATFVGGCIEYDVPASSGGWNANPPYWSSGPSGAACGPLYYVVGCDTRPTTVLGTNLNVQPPMNLNCEGLNPIKFEFEAAQRNSNPHQPPGNYSPLAAPKLTDFALPCFTDMVVNLTGDAQWPVNTPQAYNSMTFNDFAWAVEASRGNLESATFLQTSVNPLAGTVGDNNFGYIINYNGTKTWVPNGFKGISSGGQVGSQGAYWAYVQNNTHPLSDAIVAAQGFFTFLYQSCDVHLGLICFSDGIGNAPNDTWADGWESPPGSTHINGWATASATGAVSTPPVTANIAGPYVGGSAMGKPDTTPNPGYDVAGGDSNSFFLPLIQLNNGVLWTTSASYDNYSSGTPVNGYMLVGNGNVTGAGAGNRIVATGATDITDALTEAVRELNPSTGLTRPNATRAIVLFTDGSPNIDANALPPNGSFTTCMNDCATQATAAFNVNPSISIFSIGLAMDPGMVTNQQLLLNSITTAANGGSATGTSSWQQITSAGQIQTAFESIAKNLVVITK